MQRNSKFRNFNFIGVVDRRINTFPAMFVSSEFKRMGFGGAANYFSILHAMLRALDNIDSGYAKDGAILIAEDDVMYDTSFLTEVNTTLTELNIKDPHWQLLHLGACGGRKHLSHNEDIKFAEKVEFTKCGHSWLWKNGATLRYYLHYANPQPPRLQVIDKLTGRLAEKNILIVYNHAGKKIAEQARVLFGSGLRLSGFMYKPKANWQSAIVVDNPVLSKEYIRSLYGMDPSASKSSREAL
jgi:hypothetical protein